MAQVLQDFVMRKNRNQELLSVDLEEIEQEEHRPVLEFYQSNLTPLKSVLMSEIPPHIIRDMAMILHRTLLHPEEWKVLVSNMGIEDTLTISRIEDSADRHKEQPLYIALQRPLTHDKSFGFIIGILLQMKRIDILGHIKPFVENLLKRIAETKPEKVLFESKEPTAPLHDDFSDSAISLQNLNLHSESHHILANSSDRDFHQNIQKTSISERKVENAEKQQKAVLHINKIMPNNNPAKAETACTVVSNILEPNLPGPQMISSANDSSISVFIPHTNSDLAMVERLVNILQNEQFIVRTLSELEYLLMMDSAGALSAMCQEVDFIIPFVSEEFFQQIQPQANFDYLEPTDASNNRFIYQLLQTEYRSNRCLNFRVKPVIVPNMNKRILRFDALLYNSLRLWSDVGKLVKILRRTKPLIPKF